MCMHRLIWLRVVLAAVFLLFGLRLAYLQLVHGAEFRGESEKNHIRWVRSPAPRGLILDRNGRVLATSTPALSAWLVPGEVPRAAWGHLLRQLVEIGLYPTKTAAARHLRDAQRYPSYLPVRLTSKLSLETVTRVEEELAFLPGVYLRPEPIRSYPGAALAAHSLGYLREINAEELEARREEGYRLGDRIGKAGLERAFEADLRGRDGGEEVEVDAHGRILHKRREEAPRPGRTLRLTLDRDIQHAAEQAMAGRKGAVVALDPASGDILALVSAPAYDLNIMSGRISRPMVAWLHGPQRPELNRATAGLYPPGSVFKIVTAAAALERRKVTAETYYYCTGEYKGIHCWKHSGHGAVNLTEALAHSCNVAFMRMAESIGIRDLSGAARHFGLGEAVDIPGVPDAKGLVPDPAWAKRVHNRHWELGETLQVGIGQSSLAVTPVQSARIIAAIANGGKLVTPRLVTRVGDVEQPATPPTPIGLKPSTLRQLVRGLRAVTGEGTAQQLDASLHIAGKTGTAQNPGGQDHAWFVGYAPADAPQIAVAVLVEHGGHGGAVAAPIAGTIISTALRGPNTANASGSAKKAE